MSRRRWVFVAVPVAVVVVVAGGGFAMRTRAISTFSGTETGNRTLRYWLDPATGLWVKWTERIHGERGPLVYEEQATLTLQDGPL